jgi:hypothetical protein
MSTRNGTSWSGALQRPVAEVEDGDAARSTWSQEIVGKNWASRSDWYVRSR